MRFSACVSIPRIGFNILLERPGTSVLFGMLTGCSATVDPALRCQFAVKTAEVGIREGHGTTPAPDAHARRTHLLHSPCFAFAQLHHRNPPQHDQGAQAQRPSSTECETFFSATFIPSGASNDAQPSSESIYAPFSTAQSPLHVHTAPGSSHFPVRGGSHVGESHSTSDRDYAPSPSGSARSHDVPALHEDMRWSQRQRQARATELLKERIERLRGDVLIGTVSATVAPVEAFIDSAALVRILELGMQLCHDLRQGDIFMQQCAPLASRQ